MDGACSAACSQMDELSAQITDNVAAKFDDSMIQSDTVMIAEAKGKIEKYKESIEEAKGKLQEALQIAHKADSI